MFDLKEKKNQFFTTFGVIIWSCFILFPSGDKHFMKPKTTSGFCLVLEKQSMQSKFMLLLIGTTFFVSFAFFYFFKLFSNVEHAYY